MWMHYGKKMYPIIFAGGQRSFGVTGGQTLKALLTRYLKMRYSEKMNPVVFGGRLKGHLGSPEVKMQISQEFPRLNRNTKLYFSNMLR
ncbi:hypothetical protein HOLleu_20523 [Holothuria leucospilota]|uniref:Uncharacterized protein n=1 Tax=Holothuria leucospilota TaxID=206669 RepID=A0A9Q1C0T5_HOLLE|nr:hypothetical protein HOLleu_20523 [Holothuria leucospilota]